MLGHKFGLLSFGRELLTYRSVEVTVPPWLEPVTQDVPPEKQSSGDMALTLSLGRSRTSPERTPPSALRSFESTSIRSRTRV